MSKSITCSTEQTDKFYNDLIGQKYYEVNESNWKRQIKHVHYKSVKGVNGKTEYLPCTCEKCKWFIADLNFRLASKMKIRCC